MNTEQDTSTDWPRALRLYLGVTLVAHLGWEILQLPLYTLWSTGTFRQQVFAVVHCTLGDHLTLGSRSSWGWRFSRARRGRVPALPA